MSMRSSDGNSRLRDYILGIGALENMRGATMYDGKMETYNSCLQATTYLKVNPTRN